MPPEAVLQACSTRGGHRIGRKLKVRQSLQVEAPSVPCVPPPPRTSPFLCVGGRKVRAVGPIGPPSAKRSLSKFHPGVSQERRCTCGTTPVGRPGYEGSHGYIFGCLPLGRGIVSGETPNVLPEGHLVGTLSLPPPVAILLGDRIEPQAKRHPGSSHPVAGRGNLRPRRPPNPEWGVPGHVLSPRRLAPH